MADGHNFEHLPLVLVKRGGARFNPPNTSFGQTAHNKRNRPEHSAQLTSRLEALKEAWQQYREKRATDAPEAPGLGDGIPMLLRVDSDMDIDQLKRFFSFEIVAEDEDGFVIVSSEDITKFEQKIADFVVKGQGSATVAEIHEILGEGDRLRRILSPTLYADLARLNTDAEFICDVSVSCSENFVCGSPPRPNPRWPDATNQRKYNDWKRKYDEAYQRWDELFEGKLRSIEEIVQFYRGEVIAVSHVHPELPNTLPDSFTVRMRITGKGLLDIIHNSPYVFEVVEPDDISLPQRVHEAAELGADVTFSPPPSGAPKVCVVDSGIQEEHKWLTDAVEKTASYCFLPEKNATDVADYVNNGGHGTRVAGAVLFASSVPVAGHFNHSHWVQNARVLNENSQMPNELFPPTLIRNVVEQYNAGENPTRIFNQSINACAPSRKVHMSAWACEIDQLCFERDIIFVQSMGNIPDDAPAPFKGIRQYIDDGFDYPEYLDEDPCRIANPAQSFQAISVGSVAHSVWDEPDWKTFATKPHEPSAFTRSGLGIWGSIKPDVVEFGGDLLHDGGTPVLTSTPAIANSCYPELVRSTLGGGPAISRDTVGTSFAAPKVANLAASIQTLLPDEPSLLWRALIAQSALWPAWSDQLSDDQKYDLIKRIGYGIPMPDRVLGNTPHRTTFITHGITEIAEGDCHIYRIPIPAQLRQPGNDHPIRISVSLSYAARPRRTRRYNRGYLSTWVDWWSNRPGESAEVFMSRMMKDEEQIFDTSSGQFPWMLGMRSSEGTIGQIRRSIGTLQKDWAVVQSHALPDDFCIAVRGHVGWCKTGDDSVPYTLAVTIESVDNELEIYDPLRVSVTELQARAEMEVEVEDGQTH